MTERFYLSLVVLKIAASVFAQTSDVTQCIAEFQWSINALGQNPCLVGAYLETLCSSQPFSVNALPQGNHYIGPSTDNADPCFCNSVTYSMISACAGCQDRRFSNFTMWTLNCRQSDVAIGQYPRTIPFTTQVPSWATLNISLTNDTFNPLAAQREAAREATLPSTTRSSSSTSAASTTATRATQATSDSEDSSGLSSGAIAGITVGALIAVITILLALLWMKLRSKKQNSKKQDDLNSVYQPPKANHSQHIHSRSMSDPASIISPYTYSASEGGRHPPSEISTTYTTVPPMRSLENSVSPAPPLSTITSPRGYTGAAEV
ncbi:hypothetical protein AGABI1DRAFT_125013 [Agaricus bisporus var. burnettii JB137-S8]|uniref:Mid2 domain-containing protein n=1 Tax=Agaricus bisporus var. burnettii (strain JB137-S8 / ATCC MYA-4627 / FGSC 10392) TaxID=597362 RepID=K5Y3M2_AGABU|nr:uncharacterized protein AGABI1DRAFT_125013 [Agaricus bisporus var. burnettii JB137-S8]EKM82550.1 hypothetical protein AGABI1DRAFT_125013 [Agaricus bisporus var. burnettii JB137-S8]